MGNRAGRVPGVSKPWRLNPYATIAAAVFAVSLFHFTFCLLWALDQPILDLWGFRPAQTAISVPFIMSGRGFFASIVPVFGEPWRLPQEFPFYQWCVALFALVTQIPVDAGGRIVSGLFAIGTLWPVYLLAKQFVPAAACRTTFMLGSLWLFSPIVVFWGRSFLIETTVVFLSAAWLAFYLRFLSRSRWQDYVPCLIFGILGATVKIPAFVAFVVAGFLYTCWWVWHRRNQLAAVWPTLALAGASVLAAAVAILGWSRLVDHYLASNPLAALLRFASMPTWYIGSLSDRWSAELWSFAIQSRDLPDGLGAAWLVVICLSVLLSIWGETFLAVLGLLVSFLSTYLFFPLLHINNPHYLVENVLLLLAAVVVAAECLVERRAVLGALLGWGLFALAFAGEIWTTYNGTYGPHLFADLHNHPYYKAARVVAAKTPTNSVVVVFGTGWGADIPFYARRPGIVLANFFPPPLINQVLLEHPGRWLTGRKIGAIVDCTVFSNQETTPQLAAIRDKLIATTGATPERVDGSVVGSTSSFPGCTVAVPKS
jgi:Dolichyl-phosphate-mannose-protein mannosyltransferase